MQSHEIKQGAEAKIFVRDGQVVKERLPKRYRHPCLDQWLNESRIKGEAKMLQRLHDKGFPVPKVVAVEGSCIVMEHIEGRTVRQVLEDTQPVLAKEERLELIRGMGQMVRRLHDLGIIHGDLTTSNMISNSKGLFFIDFGLSFCKNSVEDKAVDLYVLERAFLSTHPQLEEEFGLCLVAYCDEEVIRRLEAVRQRGRKKIVFG